MDDERWLRILQRMPEVEEAAGPPLAVAFIGDEAYGAKRGQAWLWWPGSRARTAGPVAFNGHYPDDWGLLLVMNDAAIEKVGAGGTACMAHLSRLLGLGHQIRTGELALLVPADLAGDEHHLPARHDAVAVTLGHRPAGR